MCANLFLHLYKTVGAVNKAERIVNESKDLTVNCTFIPVSHPITDALEYEVEKYIKFEFDTKYYKDIMKRAENTKKTDANSSICRLSTVIFYKNIEYSEDLSILMEVVDFSKIISKNAELLTSQLDSSKESICLKELGNNILDSLKKMSSLSDIAAELVYQQHNEECTKQCLKEIENRFELSLNELEDIHNSIISKYAKLIDVKIRKKMEYSLGISIVHFSLIASLTDMIRYCSREEKSTFTFDFLLNKITNEVLNQNKNHASLDNLGIVTRKGFSYKRNISELTKLISVQLFSIFDACQSKPTQV